MAERTGRVGRGSDIRGDAESELDDRGDRSGGRGPTGLLAMAISGLVLYLAWLVLWERSHPAAAAARRVRQGGAAERLAAIRDLESLGPQDPEIAVPALIEGLADPAATNRGAAAEGLAASIPGVGADGAGPEAVRDALAALIKRVDDPEAAVRVRASHALYTIVLAGHGSARALRLDALEAELMRKADGPDDDVRAAAMLGLSALAQRASDAPPPRVIAALEDRSEAVRTAAARGLAPFQSAMLGMLPDLVAAMEKARPECREAYLAVLRRLRVSDVPEEIAGRLIAALIAALGDRDGGVRCQVAGMLGEFGPDAGAAAVLALRAVVEDPGQPGMPGAASEGFSRERDPAIAASQALRRVAGDESRAGSSGRTPTAPGVVAALIKLMGDPSAGRRLSAVYALTSFDADDAVVAAFVGASRDRDEGVRIAAVQALRGRGARLRSRAIEAIREAMEDRSPRVRYAAAYALTDFGVGVEPMIPALIRHAQHDPDATVRETVARAMGSLGPPAVSPAVVPMFVKAIESPAASATLRASLVGVLAGLGPAARVAAPAIVRLLRSAEEDVGRDIALRARPVYGLVASESLGEGSIALRRNAARALGVLAPGTPTADEAVAALVAALDDPADEVSQQVGESLIALGPAARASVPSLLRAMHRAEQNRDLPRAGRMAETIGRIDPAAPGAGEAITFLDEVLRSEDVLPRLFAERVLALFGPAAAPAIPELVALAGRPAVRSSPELSSVAVALGRVAPGTPAAERALAALFELLRVEPEPTCMEAVIDATARFRPGAATALPRLRELTTSPRPPVAEAARKAVDLLKTGG
jgi:HEAT repeat protein